MELNFTNLERSNKDNIFVYDDFLNHTNNSNVKIIETSHQRNNVYYNPLENKLSQQKSIFNATIKPKDKQKITYDDMLNSMNVTVVNGILRFGIDREKIRNNMAINSININSNKNTFYDNSDVNYNMEYKTQPLEEEKKEVWINSQSFNYNESQRQKENKYQNQSELNRNIKPLDPSVKNSWIYNKYFKNYKEETIENIQEHTLTKKEIEEKIINDFLERKKALKKLSQIKSTKLLFSNNNNAIYFRQNNNLNKLFKFK